MRIVKKRENHYLFLRILKKKAKVSKSARKVARRKKRVKENPLQGWQRRSRFEDRRISEFGSGPAPAIS